MNIHVVPLTLPIPTQILRYRPGRGGACYADTNTFTSQYSRLHSYSALQATAQPDLASLVCKVRIIQTGLMEDDF